MLSPESTFAPVESRKIRIKSFEVLRSRASWPRTGRSSRYGAYAVASDSWQFPSSSAPETVPAGSKRAGTHVCPKAGKIAITQNTDQRGILKCETRFAAECYAATFLMLPCPLARPLLPPVLLSGACRENFMSVTREKAQLMSASEIDRTLVRLAHEILEKTKDLDQLAFIGIRRRGVPMAQRLAAKIEALENRKIPVGILDINLYRDDLSTVDVKPVVSATDIQFSVAGKDIILMDDVLYTGRTIRAALDALFDHGRPARVQLLVLIDRGHRELPIEAKFIGRVVQTTDDEIIEVKFNEIDHMEKVLMVERATGEGA